MNNNNAENVSFHQDTKESFKDRLLQLVGSRSVRTAAKDWGVPISTLNNYINRGTEPALKVVQAIADKENISFEWLATGSMKGAAIPIALNQIEPTKDSDELRRDWLRIYDRMTVEQREEVLNHIALNGIKAILPGNIENTVPADLADSELIEIEDNLLSHGVNRTAAKVVMMALKMPVDEVREIFEAAADSARLKSSQGRAAKRGQEKKA